MGVADAMRVSFRRIGVAMMALVACGCSPPAPDANRVNCPDPVAGCRFKLAGYAVALRFSEAPRPMRPFLFDVEAGQAATVAADFAMPDMEMLPNRYQLTRMDESHWQTKVVLPVCVSGRSNWLLALTIDGEHVSVPFSAGN